MSNARNTWYHLFQNLFVFPSHKWMHEEAQANFAWHFEWVWTQIQQAQHPELLRRWYSNSESPCSELQHTLRYSRNNLSTETSNCSSSVQAGGIPRNLSKVSAHGKPCHQSDDSSRDVPKKSDVDLDWQFPLPPISTWNARYLANVEQKLWNLLQPRISSNALCLGTVDKLQTDIQSNIMYVGQDPSGPRTATHKTCRASLPVYPSVSPTLIMKCRAFLTGASW
jgi:hypothetical protein